MTTDTKPLPERFDCTNGSTPWCQGCYTMTPDEYGYYVQWEDYERIAAAKDAEIERLRADVRHLEPWRDAVFDGVAVFAALNRNAKPRTSPENMADVLDAVANVARSAIDAAWEARHCERVWEARNG